MSGRNDTQQIEKADQRNIAGHDDQNGAGRQGSGALVARQPMLDLIAR